MMHDLTFEQVIREPSPYRSNRTPRESLFTTEVQDPKRGWNRNTSSPNNRIFNVNAAASSGNWVASSPQDRIFNTVYKPTTLSNEESGR